MSTDTDSLRDDLAFMRAVVSAGDNSTGILGETYALAGLIYGAQMLLHAAQFFGVIPQTPLLAMAIGIGPTLVFIPVMIWLSWRNRAARAGSTGRAVGAVFSVAGAANMAMICVIGVVAWRERSLTIWLIYPCSLFVMQGAAWLVAWALRRRAWLALVAIGWFASAIAMAISIELIGWYLLFGALGIWLCMALPGWAMTRRRRIDAG